MAKTLPSQTLHASCVSIAGKGVLLLGESGCGKSDLALRLIDGGAALVGDDQIVLTPQEKKLLASPAATIAGMLEVRGIGILSVPYLRDIPVALAVQLAQRETIERMPEPQFFDCIHLQVPLVSLYAFDVSTPAKIRLYLESL